MLVTTRKPEPLRLVITSATLESEKFSLYFNDCPVYHVPGGVQSTGPPTHSPRSGSLLHLSRLDLSVTSVSPPTSGRTNQPIVCDDTSVKSPSLTRPTKLYYSSARDTTSVEPPSLTRKRRINETNDRAPHDDDPVTWSSVSGVHRVLHGAAPQLFRNRRRDGDGPALLAGTRGYPAVPHGQGGVYAHHVIYAPSFTRLVSSNRTFTAFTNDEESARIRIHLFASVKKPQKSSEAKYAFL